MDCIISNKKGICQLSMGNTGLYLKFCAVEADWQDFTCNFVHPTWCGKNLLAILSNHHTRGELYLRFYPNCSWARTYCAQKRQAPLETCLFLLFSSCCLMQKASYFYLTNRGYLSGVAALDLRVSVLLAKQLLCLVKDVFNGEAVLLEEGSCRS